MVLKRKISDIIQYKSNLYKTKSVLEAEGFSLCSSPSRSVWNISSCRSTAADIRCGWQTKIWERNCPIGDSSFSGAILELDPDDSAEDDVALTTKPLLLPTESFLPWPCLETGTEVFSYQPPKTVSKHTNNPSNLVY